MTLRLAMWSGPRNISTAMMRAWENRLDTTVVDEPFYACYLHSTGVDHPMREKVLAGQSTDRDEVARELSLGSVGTEVFYQKHMTHHMRSEFDLAWTQHLTHCFLIRDPRYVVNSYVKKRQSVTVDDIGMARQFDLYQALSDISGQSIPVLDARQTLLDPESTLRALCGRLGLEFSDRMLRWPAGTRASDGVWAPHWYEAVQASTSFQPYVERPLTITGASARVAEASMPYYERLLAICEAT